jgi:hypothetical protein
MPILGIVASSNYQRVVPDTGAMFPLGMVQVGSSTPSVTFSSIPSTYKHLQLRAIMQSSVSGSGYKDLFIRVNSDTGSNYARHGLYGNGSSAVAYATASIARMEAALTIPETTNNGFGVVVIDLLDYANTNKYKTLQNSTNL